MRLFVPQSLAPAGVFQWHFTARENLYSCLIKRLARTLRRVALSYIHYQGDPEGGCRRRILESYEVARVYPEILNCKRGLPSQALKFYFIYDHADYLAGPRLPGEVAHSVNPSTSQAEQLEL